MHRQMPEELPVEEGVQGMIHIADVILDVDLLIDGCLTLLVVVQPGKALGGAVHFLDSGQLSFDLEAIAKSERGPSRAHSSSESSTRTSTAMAGLHCTRLSRSE